ncbi:hypothetical protein SPE26_17635 [Bacillus thuringiensis]|uniref:Phage protein n=3 Tax=Bacillus thuringiensis TaxID=1428 RepID=A0AAW9GEH2_BACTU|nr:hypothetical protein [Bacillus thuringiensis]MBG9633898.1 hypothetical protein [Bacillus thuringiensis]MBG9668988.1 hypothetical protein [Bacillus thuringiensis]MBH0350720.1 hypothetical protein [Bacillus thuringiensis]MDY0852812.1 hypothetical protein [Bacillus thuringiensis]MDY4392553.1 hypothetical protein [Bacillus thuringiensis]
MKNNQENQTTAPAVTEAEVKKMMNSHTREIWNLPHGGRVSVSWQLDNLTAEEHHKYKQCVDMAIARMIVQLELG